MMVPITKMEKSIGLIGLQEDEFIFRPSWDQADNGGLRTYIRKHPASNMHS